MMGASGRLTRAFKKRAAIIVSLAFVLLGVTAAIANAQEYCVGGCVWGVDCPTRPSPEPGHIELPLCIDPVGPVGAGGGEVSPEPAVIEEERGQATGAKSATLFAKINSHGQRIQSIQWQYNSAVDIFGGEISLPPNSPEISGGSEIEDSTQEPIENSISLSSLEPNTSYSFRVVIHSDNTTTYGHIQSFRTAPVSEPSSVTTTPGGVEKDDAQAPPSPQQTEQSTSPNQQVARTIASPSTPLVQADDITKQPSLTWEQKLVRARKACPVKPARKRKKCLKQAEKRYSPPHKH